MSVGVNVGIYDANSEQQISLWDGNHVAEESEYYSYCAELVNTSSNIVCCKNVFICVDGGEKTVFREFTMEPGQTVMIHVYKQRMDQLTPGLHRVEVQVNNTVVFDRKIYLPRHWKTLMKYPTQSQINEVRGYKRSPYILFFPQFQTDRITEYSIDFSMDDLDKGTYFSVCQAELDITAITDRYPSTEKNYITPGSIYLGVQRLENGKAAVIMSVWDLVCKDQQGNQIILCADQVYPVYKKGVSSPSGEGRFQQYLAEWPWETHHPYRMLLQLNRNTADQSSNLTMWICDLVNMKWTKCVSWRLRYPCEYIKTSFLNGFLENYLPDYSGEIRNVTFKNIFYRDWQSGKWNTATTVTFKANYGITQANYNGWYNYGADPDSFWIITSGVEGLCRKPESGIAFTVNEPELFSLMKKEQDNVLENSTLS